MSLVGDTVSAIRNVLLLHEDVRQLKDATCQQSERLAALAAAHVDLRDRVSRLEGVIEGVGMAAQQRRIEQ